MDQPTYEVDQESLVKALGEHLLFNSLICTVTLQAVRDQQGQIQDLRLTFLNQAASENPFLDFPATVGQLATDWYPVTWKRGLFGQLVEVIETGAPFVIEKYYPEKDHTYQVTVSRFGDGVVLSYINRTPKQLAERKALQQAQILQQLIESSPDAILLADPILDQQGKIVDFKASHHNPAALFDGMFTPDDYQQHSFTQLNKSAIEVIDHYAQVFHTGIPHRMERSNHRAGRELWLDVSVSKLGDKLLLIMKDISAQKEATQEIDWQYHLLEGILDSSENVIFVAEAISDESGAVVDFCITKMNQAARTAFAETFGFDVKGMSIIQLVGGTPELLQEAIQVVETGVPLLFDNRYSPASDKWHKVSIHKLGNGLVATYVDVTAIQKALLEAQHQTDLVQGVLDSSINGVYAMEAIREQQQIIDFSILMVNQAGLEMSGHTLEQVVGNTYLTLFPMVRQVGLFDRFVQAIEQGGPFRTEMNFFSLDGQQEYWYDLSMNQTKTGLIILTFMEITHQVQMRHKLESLVEDLRRSNVDLEQFAYVASHDLQEPARKITLFTSMLQQQYTTQLPAAGLELSGKIQAASRRMQELIEGLLTYSRFSSKNQKHQLVHVSTVLDHVLLDLEASIQQREAVIEVKEMPQIRGNQIQLEQLFQNLISNAIKFTGEQTRPHIIIESGTATEEEVRESGVGKGKGWLAVRVRDNGIGFDAIYKKQVFELFKRLHNRTQYQGNGLGLAISKKVAELHGGGITVNSTPGVGTTFIIVLPALPSPKE